MDGDRNCPARSLRLRLASAGVKSYALAFLVAGILLVPARLISKALDFGGFARLMTFTLILAVAGLADRDFFYGPRNPG